MSIYASATFDRFTDENLRDIIDDLEQLQALWERCAALFPGTGVQASDLCNSIIIELHRRGRG